MKLNFNSAGQCVDAGRGETPAIKPVDLQFQPVVVSGGMQVPVPTARPQQAVKITIDPEKLKK